MKDVSLELDKYKKSLTDLQFKRFSRIEQGYNISDEAWGLCVDLAKARMIASHLSAKELHLLWPDRKEKCKFICKDEIDSAFVEILQCAFLRESFNPAKFRLCVNKRISYDVKAIRIARVTDEQGCTRYQRIGYGLIVINPFLISRLSPLLQEAFALFLLSCVRHKNLDYLSDIQTMNNVTITNKDAFCSSVQQTSLILDALHDQEVSMLLKELLKNRNMFFDNYHGAVKYYKKMCEINILHQYMAWLTQLSDEKKQAMNKPDSSTKVGKSV
jgi:hypothetical protein